MVRYRTLAATGRLLFSKKHAYTASLTSYYFHTRPHRSHIYNTRQFSGHLYVRFLHKSKHTMDHWKNKNWLPRWCSGKELACQCKRCKTLRLEPGSGRSLGVGNDNLLQYPGWNNHMKREVQWATVHEVTKSQMQPSH